MYNNMALCTIVAVMFALLFILAGIILLISIIISCCHKNTVKPIRWILMLICFVCGILSFAGFISLNNSLMDSVYDGRKDFYTVYDEEKDTITLNGTTYINTTLIVVDVYNTEILGSYIIDNDGYSSSLGTIWSLLIFGASTDYIDVNIYDYTAYDYDMILCDYMYSIYCNEDQYNEFIEDLAESIEYIDCTTYMGDYDYVEDVITDITDDEISLVNELLQLDMYDGDTISISDSEEDVISISLSVSCQDESIFIYEDLILYNDEYYYVADYEYVEYSDDIINLCCKISDESAAVVSKMITTEESEN